MACVCVGSTAVATVQLLCSIRINSCFLLLILQCGVWGTATEHRYDGVPYKPPALVRVSAEPSLLSHNQWVKGRDKEKR